MAKYDFKMLSPYDFENLVRDLLQKSLNLALECFKVGKDKGIDLRYSSINKNEIVIQCKHYANSSFSKLKSNIEKIELPKIKTLQPKRYILVTSLGLTPSNKDVLTDILSPYCQSTSDILGCDDLNNLLGMYHDVEKHHFKLWLTSIPVLEKILNGDIYRQTDIEIEHIRNNLSIYVQNKSFFEAKEYLDDLNYCLIVGIPGIGKTILAEILLVNYMEKGYEIIKIANDINEAYKVHDPSIKQLFYYDDFLGQTSLENKFNKNEEQKFLKFIEWVQGSKKTKLVITTREYILNQAKMIYEQLSRSTFDKKRCIVDLSKYTKMDRAKILFNHVYFSDLNEKHKLDILRNKAYMQIISHENYNPRIIEYMTNYAKDQISNEDDYAAVFCHTLDNPQELWSHAFENQLSLSSQELLITLGLLPNELFLDDLHNAFLSYYSYRAKKFGRTIDPNDFYCSLKELESNFIHLEKEDKNTIIRFHNPSIKDFIEHRLVSDKERLNDIFNSAIFFDQFISIVELLRKEELSQTLKKNLKAIHVCLIENAIRVISSSDTRLMNVLYAADNVLQKSRDHLSIEQRLCQLISLIDIKIDAHSLQFLNAIIKQYFSNIDKDNVNVDKDGLVKMVQILVNPQYMLDITRNEILSRTKKILLLNVHELDEFKACIKFDKAFNNEISDNDKQKLRSAFLKFVNNELTNYCFDDPDYMNYLADEFEEISKGYGANIDGIINNLRGEAIRIEGEIEDEPDDDDDWKEDYHQEVSDNEQIDAMFSCLADHVED